MIESLTLGFEKGIFSEGLLTVGTAVIYCYHTLVEALKLFSHHEQFKVLYSEESVT